MKILLRLILLVVISIVFVIPVYAPDGNIRRGRQLWTDPDGAPNQVPFSEVTVPSGGMADDGDGTGTLSFPTAGSDGWTDDGTEVRLTTSTDEVEIGSAGTLSAKLAVNGDADEVQLLV